MSRTAAGSARAPEPGLEGAPQRNAPAAPGISIVVRCWTATISRRRWCPESRAGTGAPVNATSIPEDYDPLAPDDVPLSRRRRAIARPAPPTRPAARPFGRAARGAGTPRRHRSRSVTVRGSAPVEAGAPAGPLLSARRRRASTSAPCSRAPVWIRRDNAGGRARFRSDPPGRRLRRHGRHAIPPADQRRVPDAGDARPTRRQQPAQVFRQRRGRAAQPAREAQSPPTSRRSKRSRMRSPICAITKSRCSPACGRRSSRCSPSSIPTDLQQEFDRQMSKGLVPAKLRYWDLYRERRQQIVKDPEAHVPPAVRRGVRARL